MERVALIVLTITVAAGMASAVVLAVNLPEIIRRNPPRD